MFATTADTKIPVSSLYPDRYGLGKTKVYQYLRNLRIETFQEGRNSFITVEQLELLDHYCKLLAEDKASAEAFAAQLNPREQVHEQEPEPVHGLVHDSAQIAQSPMWQLFVEAIATRLHQPPPDPLLPQRRLQEIAEHGWQVSTSQLREILGSKPREGDRYGFQLMKMGKIGRETAWRCTVLGER